MNKNDMKRITIAGVLLVVGIVLSVISWIILPDGVYMQFPGLGTGLPAFPKLLAVLIAFAFSTGFSVLSVKYEEGVRYVFIGYALHILYWVCNL